MVTVTDSSGLSVNGSPLTVTVSTQPIVSSPPTSSAPQPSLPPVSSPPLPLTITSLTGSVRFNSSGHDTLTLKGVLPNLPSLFDPTGQTLTLAASSATVQFTLNAKGQGTSSRGQFAMSLKPMTMNKQTHRRQFSGGNVSFNARLKNGTWSTLWGISATSPKSSLEVFPVEIQLNGNDYLADVQLQYSGKPTGGTLKK